MDEGKAELARLKEELTAIHEETLRNVGTEAVQLPKTGQAATTRIERSFWGVRLTEHDLYRLATIVQKMATATGTSAVFEVEAGLEGDGKQQYRFTQPDHFTHGPLPRTITNVRMMLRDSVGATCLVECKTSPRYSSASTNFDVAGTDEPIVDHTAQELTRTLREASSGSPIVQILHREPWASLTSLPASIIVASIVVISITTFADIFRRSFVEPNLPGFSLSPAGGVYTFTVFLVVVLVFISILFFLDMLRILLPNLQFSGRFCDPGSSVRAAARWFVVVVIVALIVGILASLIASGIVTVGTQPQ